jgi:hypothetical protein
MGEFENGRPVRGGPAQGGPVQVADASGAVPASAVPAAGPDLEGQRAALMRRLDAIATTAARYPNASATARAGIDAAKEAVNRQLRELDRLETRQQRVEDRTDNRRYTEQLRIDERAFRDQQRAEAAKDRAAQREAEMAGKAPTGDQANAATFATRMAEADKILSDPAIYQTGIGARGAGRAMAESLPVVGNALAGVGPDGPKYQQLRQAQRDFVNAVLRKESGAAISASEFANAEKQYFPQPGDSAEVIEQKARNRATAIDAIGNSAAPSFVKQFQEQRRREREQKTRGGGAQPVRVSSPDEARKLPSGTSILLPDGSIGRVP